LRPAVSYFEAVHRGLGAAAFLQLPSLCWIFGGGVFLHVLCASGIALSLFLFLGIASRFALVLLWVGYLSLSAAGQMFFNFQWDALLLETTLLAIFLAPAGTPRPATEPRMAFRHLLTADFHLQTEPSRLPRLLLRWLLFRLMFLAGIVKLNSGDELWRSLTALTVHYETQPLPTPLAWYVHQLPENWHRASCAGMFVIELIAPFFIFAPRSLRHNATVLIAGFMVAVALTGNYTYFNLLALALCVHCLDDAWWRNFAIRGWRRTASGERTTMPETPAGRRAIATPGNPINRESAASWLAEPPRPGLTVYLAVGAAVFVLGYTGVQSLPAIFRGLGTPPGFNTLATVVAPFRSLNNYGLFAVMTHPRPELVFEGSDDGRSWEAYGFPHKPGALDRRPTWVAPHQPRLDWQLWFAALGPPQQNRWVIDLCEHLLRGTPAVLGLLAFNPFPDHPPHHVRVVRYEYRFTDAATRARTGHWWDRTPTDFYVPAASLRRPNPE